MGTMYCVLFACMYSACMYSIRSWLEYNWMRGGWDRWVESLELVLVAVGFLALYINKFFGIIMF